MSLIEQFDGITVNELVMWKRPQATGVVVASIAVVLFLLGYMEYTLLTLGCIETIILSLKLIKYPSKQVVVVVTVGLVTAAVAARFVMGLTNTGGHTHTQLWCHSSGGCGLRCVARSLGR